MPASGLTQGAMPIMGFSYGAGNGKRLQHTLSISLRVCFVIMVLGCVLFMAAPEWLLGLFDASEEMLAIGIPALRIIWISFLPAAIGDCPPCSSPWTGRLFAGSFPLRQLVITPPGSRHSQRPVWPDRNLGQLYPGGVGGSRSRLPVL